MLPPISIRPVREVDAAAIVELLNPIIAAGLYTAMTETFSVAEQVEFIRGFPARGVYHLALGEDDQVLGIQDVVPFSTEAAFKHVGVISTFVALTAHHTGVGRSLSQATFPATQALGFEKIMANVRADNPQALAFYKSQGFNLIGTAHRQAVIRGQYVDEVLLEKFLTPPASPLATN